MPSYRELRDALNKMSDAQLDSPVQLMLEVEVGGIVSHPYASLAPCIFFDASEEHPVLLPTAVEVS